MNEILMQGIAAMLVGMGTVLFFLCVTILAMYIMSKTIKKLNEIFPEPVVQTTGAKPNIVSQDDESIAVAILSALLRK